MKGGQMRKVITIISLIALAFIMIGCGQTATERNLENSRKALDDFRKSQDKAQKIIDDYRRNH